MRYVDLLPALRDELDTLKAPRKPKPDDPVFPSAVRTRLDRNRILKRVLGAPEKVVGGETVKGVGAVGAASKQLAKDGLAPLPDGLTLHALRRTFGSLLIALGRDPAYAMAQMGHTSPTMTLGLYAQVMNVAEADRERLRSLVEGDYLALAGTGDVSSAIPAGEREGVEA